MPHIADVDRLKQLIAALDARHVQPDRASEAGIAVEAAEMRAKAVERLAELVATDRPLES